MANNYYISENGMTQGSLVGLIKAIVTQMGGSTTTGGYIAVGDVASFGTFSSTTAGSGIAISSSRPTGFNICGDDAGVALTAGSYKAGRSRMLVTTAITTGDISIYGHLAQVKVTGVSISNSGWMAGLWGYCETITGASVSNCAGVHAMCDIPSGATILTGCIAAGVLINSQSLAGTHTGKASMIHIPNPLAGTWDYFLDFGSAPGAIVADTSNTPSAATYKIKCRIGSTDFYLAGFADF